MAKKPTITSLQNKITKLEEIIDQKSIEIEQATRKGLSLEDKTILSFFKNLPDNISVWASRGKNDNYEIVFWNKGAENIYGYGSKESLHKNFLTLFICDEQRKDAEADCSTIIQTGTPYKNNIATDTNRYKKRITLITNTFRVDDYEREGEFLQGEIGLDVTDLQSFTRFRSLEELHAKLEMLKNLINAISKIDNEALMGKHNQIDVLSEKIITHAKDTFGESHLYLLFWLENTNLPVNSKIYSNKLIDEGKILIEKANSYCSEIHTRIKTKTPILRLTTDKSRNAFCPIYSDIENNNPLGYFLIEFDDNFHISDDTSWAVDVFINQIYFSLKYKVLFLLNESIKN